MTDIKEDVLELLSLLLEEHLSNTKVGTHKAPPPE